MVTFLYLKDVWFNSNNSCVSQLESLTTLRHAKSDWAKKRKCNTITRTVNGRCFVDSLKNVSPAIRKLKDELQVILWPLSGGGVLWSLMNDRSFALPGSGLHVSCFLLSSSDLMLMLRFSSLSWQNSSGWWWAVEDLRNTLPALILFIIFFFCIVYLILPFHPCHPTSNKSVFSFSLKSLFYFESAFSVWCEETLSSHYSAPQVQLAATFPWWFHLFHLCLWARQSCCHQHFFCFSCGWIW